jgi:hypothetical protein
MSGQAATERNVFLLFGGEQNNIYGNGTFPVEEFRS